MHTINHLLILKMMVNTSAFLVTIIIPTNEGKDTIKVHFTNLNRGEISGLHPDLMKQRREDLARMLMHIKEKHPNATDIMGGSWLYNLPQYRDTFPAEFTQGMKRMVPNGFEHIPDSVGNMSFTGNSLWGQFKDRRGGPRISAYKAFITAADQAKSPENLINAFPDKPMQTKCNIEVFYRELGITG